MSRAITLDEPVLSYFTPLDFTNLSYDHDKVRQVCFVNFSGFGEGKEKKLANDTKRDHDSMC